MTNAFSCVSVIMLAPPYTADTVTAFAPIIHRRPTVTRREAERAGSGATSSTRRPPASPRPSPCWPGTAPRRAILAGGHSLIPMMKLRLAQPETLVDINPIGGLRYLERSGDQLRIGTLARHADLLARPGGR